jgi:hypothetical protein
LQSVKKKRPSLPVFFLEAKESDLSALQAIFWGAKDMPVNPPLYGLPKAMILKEMESEIKNRGLSPGVRLFYIL